MTWLDEQDAGKVDAALAKLRSTERGRTHIVEAGGDERFGLWLALVDQRMLRLIGLGYRDISDWRWADAYEDGYSPRDAAREALESDDTYQEFMRS